jgi:hypothetical protein
VRLLLGVGVAAATLSALPSCNHSNRGNHRNRGNHSNHRNHSNRGNPNPNHTQHACGPLLPYAHLMRTSRASYAHLVCISARRLDVRLDALREFRSGNDDPREVS